jgi:alpha-2-macroglobulin
MKADKLLLFLYISLFIVSCGPGNNKNVKQNNTGAKEDITVYIPIDKGYSEYIAGYTSGIISVNAGIEIRFTPEFALKADKQKLSGLFEFEPSIKGRAEWTDDVTLVFRPSRLLEPGKVYSGGLNLYKFNETKERLRVFPLRIQTLRKDFQVSLQGLQCSSAEGTAYELHGEVVVSDFIQTSEVESYVSAKLNNHNINITWDHSSADNIHRFIAANIVRTEKKQELILKWDGSSGGIRQKGSMVVNIPPKNEFIVQGVSVIPGENQRIDIVFSDPVDAKQETDGLIWFKPLTENSIQINGNTISVFPSSRLQGSVELNIEASVKNSKGAGLMSSFSTSLDFTAVYPGIMLSGKGVILPVSGNLIFPFKAANLKAVDLKIIKIFENNLPYFLQDNDFNGSGSLKRFGRMVYSGRVDLVTSPSLNKGAWNIYSIDLADYIDVEPGVLYKVKLSMRPSYSLYPCSDNSSDTEKNKYEEALSRAKQQQMDYWDDPENYYEDFESSVFYRFGYNWRDRQNPCKYAFYSPDRSVTRSLLASNLGLIAKTGEDNILHVIVSDLRTAHPLSEVNVEAYDLQMQLIVSGKTDENGFISLFCMRKPFLVIAKKDNDRNYLKTNDGSSISLSSFDVAGIKPENGIKAFIYGERDVWRPGDSIFLSILIKDLKNDLPSGHPVQFELINPLDQRVDNQVQSLTGSNLLVFSTKTSADAVTGNYNALFRIGGATFSKRVRIETIKPNRLKVDLSFPDNILRGDSKTTGNLNAKWLNGAVAKNLKSTIDLIYRKTKTSFEKWGQYDFDDPSSKFSSETIRVFDGSINDNGSAQINLEPNTHINAPGMVNAVFTTRVFEQGGDASIMQKNWKYSP